MICHSQMCATPLCRLAGELQPLRRAGAARCGELPPPPAGMPGLERRREQDGQRAHTSVPSAAKLKVAVPCQEPAVPGAAAELVGAGKLGQVSDRSWLWAARPGVL